MGNITSVFKNFKEKLIMIHSDNKRLPKLIDSEEIEDLIIDDYYVKLNMIYSRDSNENVDSTKTSLVHIGDNEEILGSKYSVEIEGIFGSEAKGKVLILGKAGVGKTTLMHYISYKWAKGELWSNNFEYVFRIRLKDLNSEWEGYYKKKYYKGDLEEKFHGEKDLFTCFLHNSLGSKAKQIISLESLRSIVESESNKSKILFLIDGYDEITQLLGDEKGKNAQSIIDELKTYPNLIMTSRPNSVPKKLENEFKSVIENIGLDIEGISQYVKNFFKNNQDAEIALIQFLEGNRSIKDICTVPINTMMICLAWSDESMQKKLELVQKL